MWFCEYIQLIKAVITNDDIDISWSIRKPNVYLVSMVIRGTMGYNVLMIAMHSGNGCTMAS